MFTVSEVEWRQWSVDISGGVIGAGRVWEGGVAGFLLRRCRRGYVELHDEHLEREDIQESKWNRLCDGSYERTFRVSSSPMFLLNVFEKKVRKAFVSSLQIENPLYCRCSLIENRFADIVQEHVEHSASRCCND